MSDQAQYIRYIKIPVNGGRGYYMLTHEYFVTCTITQFKSILKEIRYNKYLLSDIEINKVFNFIGQEIAKKLDFLRKYSGCTAKKNNLKKKLEILSTERGLYYDV